MKLEEKIKKNIEEKRICPKSKLTFVCKEWFIWFLGFLSVVTGSLIVSASLFYIKNTHWGLYKITHDNLFSFLFEFLPFIWIILFSVFVFLTYKFIRYTKKGYKYNFIIISVIVLLLSFVFGVTSFSLGLGFLIENKIGKNIPFYKNIEMKEKVVWNNENKGLFVGSIKKDGDNYVLETEEKSWVIDIADLPENLMFYFNFDEQLKEEDLVRIVGTTTNPDTLYPCMIFPFDIEQRNILSNRKLKIKNEINPSELRINNCRGVRPYMRLLEQQNI